MNGLNLFFNIVTVLMPAVSFIIVFLSVKKLRDYAGTVPETWQKMLIGLGFITFSEAFSIYKLVYMQSAYYLDFLSQVFEIAGLTYFLLGLIPYLDDIIG